MPVLPAILPALLLLLLLPGPGCPQGSEPGAEPAASAARCEFTLEHPGAPGPAERLTAGAPFRLTLRVEATGPFPGPGESLRVWLPFYHRFGTASLPQGHNPSAPGYTRLREAPPGVSLQFVNRLTGPLLAHHVAVFFELLFERPMRPGETLEVVYGDGDLGLARAPALAVRPGVPGYKPIRCERVSPDGAELGLLCAASPLVLAAAPERFQVVLPASARPGELLEARLAALDRFGNVCEEFDGDVFLRCAAEPGANGGLSLRPARRGAGTVGGLRFARPGVYRVDALGREDRSEGPLLTGRSNPVRVSAGALPTYFGDLHVHCGEVSADAYGSMEEVYRGAAEVRGLDFVAKTDHDVELTPELWRRTRELAAAWQQPGRFVTFLGYEWTPAYSWGHRSVLFPAGLGELISSARRGEDTPEALWRMLERTGGLGLPHMPSADVTEHHRFDWSRHREGLEPLVEIYSQWTPLKERLTGQDIETNPAGVQKALTLGYRLGIVAGSDNHTGMAGRLGGLAGVRAATLTSDAIWEALLARRTFGTTGERILVDFAVDGCPAGSESAAATGPVTLTAEAHGTGPLDRLEVVRGWRGAPLPLPVIHTWSAAGAEDLTAAWTDPAPLEEAFYYLRVVQADGARAWSSPIWVKRPGEPDQPSSRPEPDSWTAAPFPAGWLSTQLVGEPVVRPTTASGQGFEAETRAGRLSPPGEFFQFPNLTGSEPFPLEAGREYRFRCTVASTLPAVFLTMLVDESPSNPGLFEARPLAGMRLRTQVESRFQALPMQGLVRLVFFFPAGRNSFRVEEVRLEAANEPPARPR